MIHPPEKELTQIVTYYESSEFGSNKCLLGQRNAKHQSRVRVISMPISLVSIDDLEFDDLE
jgi:hypothetical protein